MSLISRDDRGKPRRDASGRGNARNAAMRKRKNPAENRASIVAAAIEEFAARGFKGASMDAIAARTHTTRAMINYYFGSKEKLYLSVLERAYADIREAETKLALDHLSPVDAIRKIMQHARWSSGLSRLPLRHGHRDHPGPAGRTGRTDDPGGAPGGGPDGHI